MQIEKNKNLQDEIKKSISNNNFNMLREIFDENNEVSLAKAIDKGFSIREIVLMLRKIPKSIAAEVFAYLSEKNKEEIISILTNKEIKIMFEYMYTDDITEFIETLPEEKRNKILSSLSRERKAEIDMILNFEEETAGALISTDYIELDQNLTVVQALENIKKEEKLAETIDICFVTNENGMLFGVVSIEDILLSPEDTLISDIMHTDVVSLDTDDEQSEVIKTFKKYDVTVIPVVNRNHILMGIITIDDVYDLMEEEVTEDLQKLTGITPIEGSYIQMPILKIYRSRITWLLILMLSATVSGIIITKNIEFVKHFPTLLVFIPVLMDTAGNAGSQSSAMVVRGISVDNMDIKDIWYVIKTELLNSIILGLILFVVNYLRILIFMPTVDQKIALLVSITVYVVVIVANLIGGILPLLASFLKQDPASMSTPILTTMCDAISLTIYFALATYLLGGMINV